MELTKRTLVRHLLIVALLIALLPIVLGSAGFPLRVVRSWAATHAVFIVSVLLLTIVVGLVSEALVRRQRVRLLILCLLAGGQPRAAFRAFRRDRGNWALRLFLQWGGCSRCVSYWIGGLTVLAAGALYWGWRPYALVYFMLVGAGLSAAVATAAHLRNRLRLRQDENL